jgi:hypothetical protein
VEEEQEQEEKPAIAEQLLRQSLRHLRRRLLLRRQWVGLHHLLRQKGLKILMLFGSIVILQMRLRYTCVQQEGGGDGALRLRVGVRALARSEKGGGGGGPVGLRQRNDSDEQTRIVHGQRQRRGGEEQKTALSRLRRGADGGARRSRTLLKARGQCTLRNCKSAF